MESLTVKKENMVLLDSVWLTDKFDLQPSKSETPIEEVELTMLRPNFDKLIKKAELILFIDRGRTKLLRSRFGECGMVKFERNGKAEK